MFTNRLLTLLVVVALAAVVAFTAQTIFPSPDRTYHESADQILREYDLGERYGETPSNSAEQASRESVLGERYGDTPESNPRFTAEQILREYWLGERYGVTP